MAKQKGDAQPDATGGAAVGGGRPDERELLAQVLAELDDVPETLSERMTELLDSENRAEDIRDLFEELTR